MTDLNPVEKAEQAVRAAETDTAAVQLAMAAMELARLATQQAQQPSQYQACQHDHGKARRSTGEWVGIACAVCVGSIGLAFASLALAIAACCGTGCFLILYRLWTGVRNPKGR